MSCYTLIQYEGTVKEDWREAMACALAGKRKTAQMGRLLEDASEDCREELWHYLSCQGFGHACGDPSWELSCGGRTSVAFYYNHADFDTVCMLANAVLRTVMEDGAALECLGEEGFAWSFYLNAEGAVCFDQFLDGDFKRTRRIVGFEGCRAVCEEADGSCEAAEGGFVRPSLRGVDGVELPGIDSESPRGDRRLLPLAFLKFALYFAAAWCVFAFGCRAVKYALETIPDWPGFAITAFVLGGSYLMGTRIVLLGLYECLDDCRRRPPRGGRTGARGRERAACEQRTVGEGRAWKGKADRADGLRPGGRGLEKALPPSSREEPS